MDIAPEYSDQILLSDQEVYVEVENRFVNGKSSIFSHMRCPSCYNKLPKSEHGRKSICNKCDLEMISFGNALYVWRDERVNSKNLNRRKTDRGYDVQ